MARDMELEFKWNKLGEISYKFSHESSDPRIQEGASSVSAIVLLDHSLSTLESQIAQSLGAEIIERIFTSNLETKPIEKDLRSAKLVYKPSPIHTIFKAEYSADADNQKLQAGIKQLTLNYIGLLLSSVSKENAIRIKVGVYDWLAVYEKSLEIFMSGQADALQLKAFLVSTLGGYMAKWPHEYATKPETLSIREKDSVDLAKKWAAIPINNGKPLFFS